MLFPVAGRVDQRLVITDAKDVIGSQLPYDVVDAFILVAAQIDGIHLVEAIPQNTFDSVGKAVPVDEYLRQILPSGVDLRERIVPVHIHTVKHRLVRIFRDVIHLRSNLGTLVVFLERDLLLRGDRVKTFVESDKIEQLPPP